MYQVPKKNVSGFGGALNYVDTCPNAPETWDGILPKALRPCCKASYSMWPAGVPQLLWGEESK